nr:MAG: hypothetical protein [Caudoviricetes sp.]
MNKSITRMNIRSDIDRFLNNGNTITIIPPETIPRSNTASCRHRRGMDIKINSSTNPFPVSSWWNKMTTLHSV